MHMQYGRQNCEQKYMWHHSSKMVVCVELCNDLEMHGINFVPAENLSQNEGHTRQHVYMRLHL